MPMTDNTLPSASKRLQHLEMRSITKRFPGVLANNNVNFDVRAGEIHALLGENGAGKSTLMKILFGLYQPDEGEIRINGEPVRITCPADAIGYGIGMVHQRSEEHTSELQSRPHLVCRLLLEKKKNK